MVRSPGLPLLRSGRELLAKLPGALPRNAVHWESTGFQTLHLLCSLTTSAEPARIRVHDLLVVLLGYLHDPKKDGGQDPELPLSLTEMSSRLVIRWSHEDARGA